MKIERSSGILMPVFSLPSPHGIGTLGKAAYDFIDFLRASGQTYWQMLPLGQTGYSNSPYQSFSSFAGNPYLVDLDMLVEDGLLTAEEVAAADFGSDPEHINYGKMYEQRFPLLRIAAKRGLVTESEALAVFVRENQSWVIDYALYMSVKSHFNNRPWIEWPEEDIRLHKKEAVEKYLRLLHDDVAFYEYVQLLFYRQWRLLKNYAKKQEICLIGDLPIYVAMDSADIWASPEWFRLDSDNRPIEVAGVPPDYFNEDGQLWGNPLYNWDAMKKDGYGWWIRRIHGSIKLFDVLRIDHFRGLESYWAIPYESKTAKIGRWLKGPGEEFVKMIGAWFYGTNFIAEDLGILTPEVRDLLEASGFPGMRVLEFGFAPKAQSSYLPHKHIENCIVYTGTHDNSPLMLWKDEVDPAELAFAKKYLGLNEEEGVARGMIRAGMSSVSNLFIAQLQDFLELGEGSRINTPGTPMGNWDWRVKDGILTEEVSDMIHELTEMYGRLPKWEVEAMKAAEKAAEEAAAAEKAAEEAAAAEKAAEEAAAEKAAAEKTAEAVTAKPAVEKTAE